MGLLRCHRIGGTLKGCRLIEHVATPVFRARRSLIRVAVRVNNAPGFVCRGHVVTWIVNFHGEPHGPRFPNTTEPHGPHRSCDGHHIIIDYREDCDRQHSRETSAVISWRRELPIEWGMAMSTFRNQTSPTQGDYHRPFGKVEARLHMKLQKTGRQSCRSPL